ncbi:ABC transporter ATP-binding protein [Thermosediminibacter litoriperuensis]|uniref:Fluoroquinolone transport system ATP-binding protein n=1 Tax=Thermosediminibacter litoriperuensis TaxID=291989 RepID=A0A5S5ATN9_9FIRM|nr:ABC transporter ATP-binding protein [Thermosediminibacter litoriperuensis]TYP55446.1 fluoroquinolone transport system ATP-binding protein [Thermosediminibacter litoriperuensis]
MLTVKNLYHSYTGDENYAVKDVSFEIQQGEIFGFLGPSGAGKSTTQKILTGLLPLQRGEVKIGGIDIKRPTERLFNMIGVSFEHPNVYKKLTGLENLEFYRRLFSVPTEDPMKLLKMVGLEHAAHQRAGGYSKGMLQRLVFARSMINSPKMWFLDEPTAGLDPATASRIKEIIWQKKKGGTTIFLTSHNMHIADELCDRVAFINSGEIVLIDSPRNLKLKYGSKMIKVEYREGEILRKEYLSMVEERDRERLNRLLKEGNIETIHSQEATLEEIFIRVTGRKLE